jgi:hypothetical protein
MLTRPGSSVAAPAAETGTSPKLVQLLRKRLRRLLRVALALALGLALAATALAIWWLTSLNGLPDIGEPFDVAAFRASRVPDDQNAFTFLRRADEKLTPMPAETQAASVSGVVSWSQADPKLRAWVEANRQALELFQQGAGQADAANPAGDSGMNGQRLVVLVLLEGGKRQEGGDTAGAWDCYRAVLRMATHTRRRGSLHQRHDLDGWNGWLQQRLAAWAADPRTTIPQIRNALEEVLKSEPTPDGDSFAVKAGYLEMMRSLERPVPPIIQQEVGWEYDYRLGDMQVSPQMADSLDAACRFLLREPERSRRVLRLLCANWLAHVEAQQPRRRNPAVVTSFPLLMSSNPVKWGTTSVPLYPISPATPAGTHALPPQEVASWLDATYDLKLRILVANTSQRPWSPDRLRDRRAHSDLVLMLATEIYRRERGSLPPSEKALVGTYLKSLPDDGSADLAEEMTPTVE